MIRDRHVPQVAHRVFRQGDEYPALTFLWREWTDEELEETVAREILTEYPDAVEVRWRDVPKEVRRTLRREAVVVVARPAMEWE